ncbi:MAG: MBL fold metallo-hydrolase [Desulfobacteraceae bacterium]|nr:MBL fold metallo-hydrolase [Desulfobacteraceae bacterium]MDH3721250.1 MBL fold metallo-hydrolase [Desulfobacteraceae bacterium]MDH3836878.1 MBL fold metallo-hydrolase [Desulfobacteraceae bacterium]MDH3872949.1 MBL fold metallo-hydrolase [Desulfobacteraceae bacterium]MDH3956916.1 MBL fold metallo-hydrolase [Desulfobacteraceae bacterium]
MKPTGTAVDSDIQGVKMTDNIASEQFQVKPDYNLGVCILASGSKGNAVFISSGDTSLLIDAGLSGIEIERRLKSRGLDPKNLDAILVSHEHSDHIQGVGVLSRRYKLPVYINSKTRKAAVSQLGNLYDSKNFECGSTFTINDLSIHPFSISHDAKDPCGFTVNQNGTKIGIATDLGIATSMVKAHLKGCTLLILEANHDEKMLINGPYPWPVKQRVKSRIGHLSNEESKALLNELQHDGLKHVMLAHLSETNNTPQKAFNEVGQALTRCEPRLYVASQNECGALLLLK